MPFSPPPLYQGEQVLQYLTVYLGATVYSVHSIALCVQVVQEYERAVIFRLGRLVRGGAKAGVKQYTSICKKCSFNTGQ